MAGPIPRTSRSSSGLRNPPRVVRSSTIRRARAGPTPGRRSSSSASDRLRLTREGRGAALRAVPDNPAGGSRVRADAPHAEEIFRPSEATRPLACFDDGAGGSGADTWETVDLHVRGAVRIDELSGTERAASAVILFFEATARVEQGGQVVTNLGDDGCTTAQLPPESGDAHDQQHDRRASENAGFGVGHQNRGAPGVVPHDHRNGRANGWPVGNPPRRRSTGLSLASGRRHPALQSP